MKKTVAKTPTNKTVETIDHGDGRKSVTVHVDTIDVPVTDNMTKEAKEAIEKRVLPQLGKQKIRVTVIHKPSNSFVSAAVALTDVRKFAEQCVEQFDEVVSTQSEMLKYRGTTRKENFCVVEYDENTKETKVTQL